MNTYLACLWRTKEHPQVEQASLLPYLLRKPKHVDAWHSPSGHVEIHSFQYWPELTLPKTYLFKKEAQAVSFDGFPDTGSDADVESAENFERGLFDAVQKDVRRLQGEFSVAYGEDRRLTVYLNPNGSHPIFYVDQPGYVAFSNRLPLLLLLPGISHDLDPEAAQWLCYQGFTQCNVTAFKAVRKLSEGAVATATPEAGLRIRPTTYKDIVSTYSGDFAPKNLGPIFETHCNELAGYVRRMHAFYGKLGMTLRLSGGKDSRVVLALLLHAGLVDAIDDIYTSGPLFAPDVISAQDIIAKAGLQDRYRIVRDTSIYDELRLDMNVLVESLNVTAGQLSVHDFLPIHGFTQKISVSGHQGLRDAWFRHCPTDSLKKFGDAMFATYFHDPLGLLGEKTRARFLQQYLGIFERFHKDEQAPLDAVAEIHAYREVQGTWAAAANMAQQISSPSCTPLLHPRLCSLTLAMPKAYRKNEMYHFMTVATMAPEFLNIPFADQQWFPELRELLKDAITVPNVSAYKSSRHFPALRNRFLPPLKIACYNSLKPYMAALAEKYADFLEPYLSIEKIRLAMQVAPAIQQPELVCGMGLYNTLLLAEHGLDVFHQDKTRAIGRLLNDTVKERVIIATDEGAIPGHIESGGAWQAVDSTMELLDAPETGAESKQMVRCVTSEKPWAGVCWGGDTDKKASLPCKPDTSYVVSTRVKGLENYHDENLHIAVYDQENRRLSVSTFPISSEFHEHNAPFTTGPTSTHIRINVVKAKSPALVSFLVSGLVVNPARKSREDHYVEAIERCEASIADFVREQQAIQSPEHASPSGTPSTSIPWRHLHIRNANPEAVRFYLVMKKGWRSSTKSQARSIPCGDTFVWGIQSDHGTKISIRCDQINFSHNLTIEETVQSYYVDVP